MLLRWFCTHECTSWKLYEELHKLTHQQAKIHAEPGLNVNPLYPHMAAIPDGYVTCSCCGEGIVEVMCSICFPQPITGQLPKSLDFCLHMATGAMRLKTDHDFYYQVQAQLHITKKKYCDFVVWTLTNIHVERIFPAQKFWQRCVEVSSDFYVHAVLPELMAKWFSRKYHSAGHKSPTLTEPICYCRSTTKGIIVKCQSDACQIKRFHLTCLGLKVVPCNNWICIDCKALSQLDKKESLPDSARTNECG